MQALFYMDADGGDWREELARFRDCFCPHKKALPFFMQLVEGVVAARTRIDHLIEGCSSNWKIGRMSGVDRNIMRVAVYELLYCGDIPSKVSINEAIDIGKKYGTEDSGAFINGILDSIRAAMDSGQIDPAAEPATHEDEVRKAAGPKTPPAGVKAPPDEPRAASRPDEVEKPAVQRSVALSPRIRKRPANRNKAS